MESLRPNGQRAKIAIMLVWTVLAIETISIFSDYLQYDLLQTVADGNPISPETATSNDLRQKIIAVIYLVAYVISGFTFIQWFRRAYYNLHLKAETLLFTEGWAAGCWFVPIISLYRPQQIMKELYEETQSLLTKKDPNTALHLSTKYIGWWWTLWLIASFLGQFVFRYSLMAESLEELTTATIASIISSVIAIPLAISTVRIIKDYAEVEPSLGNWSESQELKAAVVTSDFQSTVNE